VHYKPLLDKHSTLQRKPRPHHPATAAAILRPHRGRDHDWPALRHALHRGKAADCVPVLATDPLYILYTRARPANPKRGARQWRTPRRIEVVDVNLYGVRPGEVWWCGLRHRWVVGHSYIIYGPCFMARPDHVRGQADRHAGRRRLLAVISDTRPWRCSPRRRLRAIRKEDPRQIHPSV